MDLHEIKTPAFIIDLPILQKNLDAMKSRAHKLGVRLRPHTKTHKTREIAEMQVDSSRSLTVSTLAEAEFFLGAGFTDMIYAVPLFPDKLEMVTALIRQGAELKILIDHPSMISTLESRLRNTGISLKTLIKIDCGYHRAGLPPDSETAFTMAREIRSSQALRFEGILTHAGHSYNCRNTLEIIAASSDERKSVTSFAEKLKASGIPCPVISTGSTPTATHAENLEGVTEIRPGCYVFHDKYQADIGTCSMDSCAAMVLAGIIGSYPDRNQLLVDAGALALSKDPGAVHTKQTTTYGILPEHKGMFLSSLSQEHGIITSSAPIDFSRFKIGRKVLILPNHCCLAAALFPGYHIIDNGKVVDIWKPVRGW